MKAKTLSLVAGMALAANIGIAQAAALDETAKFKPLHQTAEMPDILKSMDTTDYQGITNAEMGQISGERLFIFGKKVWDWGWKHKIDVCIPSCP
jgi:hypothetical protein